MSKTKTAYMSSIMQKHSAGKQMQMKAKSNVEGNWYDVKEPSWNWAKYDYREKPKETVVTISEKDRPKTFIRITKRSGHIYLNRALYSSIDDGDSILFEVTGTKDDDGYIDEIRDNIDMNNVEKWVYQAEFEDLMRLIQIATSEQRLRQNINHA